ncbi:MAG: amino acid ABC transporter permease, partial [Gammaproteobacteria bacterium]|nr:amino acid ABC transporter permease [Gammaproteobacteria bacterium]
MSEHYSARVMRLSLLPVAASLLFFSGGLASQQAPIVVGSKNFTESYVLAEIMAQTLEFHGLTVEREFGFAGTLVAFEALRAGEIDLYAEYSGTISQAILQTDSEFDGPALVAALAPLGLEPLEPFGF